MRGEPLFGGVYNEVVVHQIFAVGRQPCLPQLFPFSELVCPYNVPLLAAQLDSVLPVRGTDPDEHEGLAVETNEVLS